jgi:hypothetical protein
MSPTSAFDTKKFVRNIKKCVITYFEATVLKEFLKFANFNPYSNLDNICTLEPVDTKLPLAC